MNKLKNLVIISGEAGAGKDTLADYIEAHSDNYQRVTFAKNLKELAYGLGWDGKKDERGRTLLQDLGKLLKSYHGKDYFVRAAFVNVPDTELIVVTDARFDTEFEYSLAWANEHGFTPIIVRIDRSSDPNWKSALTEEQKKDCSENEWKKFIPDVVIQNDGTENFFRNIEDALFHCISR